MRPEHRMQALIHVLMIFRGRKLQRRGREAAPDFGARCGARRPVQRVELTVDLVDQRIILASGAEIPFTVDPHDRHTLMDGLDDIDRTMRHEGAITRFEERI